MTSRKVSSPDDDDYWGSSSAQKIKTKGNLFDDKVNVDEVKNILRRNDFDELDEEDDTINWDGTSSAPVAFVGQSARYRSPSTASSVPKAPQVAGIPIGESRLPLPETQAVKPQQTRAQPSHSEVAKLEAQVNMLTRNLNTANKEKYVQIPPKEMVRRILIGENYFLEGYKSLDEKVSLLDEAIRSCDGNAITAAVVFVKNTVKASIFQRTLLERPVAVEHYINYLRAQGQFETLDNLLGMLGRHQEASMIKYKQALLSSNPETKIRQLQTCHRLHFTNLDQGFAFEGSMIQQQISLLERQLPIEAADSAEALKNLPPFRDMPRAASIVGLPIITTLFYCCLYHWGLQENFLSSPMAIRKAHGLTDAQFIWTAIRALVKIRRWKDIEVLFQTKGWLGGTKMKAIVPFDRVVLLLNSLDAPRDVKNKYCNLIDDTQLKMETAKKFGCHESLIETYIQLRDRQALVALQGKLKTNSQEWFYATDALGNSSTKWKN